MDKGKNKKGQKTAEGKPAFYNDQIGENAGEGRCAANTEKSAKNKSNTTKS